jgi:hypothetical protein
MGTALVYVESDLLTQRFFLPVSIFCRRDMEGLFEGSAEAIVSLETDFGSDLVDGVISFFQELFSLFEAKLQAVLVGAGLEEFPEALLQFKLINPCAIGEDGNVEMIDGVFFDDGLGQFDGGNVVEFGTLDGVSVAADSFFAHGDKV